MSITKSSKDPKFSNNYNQIIKTLSLILDTETNNKKSKQLEKLISERDKTDGEKKTKDGEISKANDERKKLLNIASYVREIEKEETRLNTNSTTHNPRMKNFLGTGGTKWRTNGWLANATNHFTPSSGQLDNLYKIKVNNSEVETTEEQIISTIAYIVQALKNVDAADFTAKYNAKQSDSSKQTKVKDYLTRLQQQEIIVGSDKDSAGNKKQPSYDFASTYQKYDKSTNTWTTYTSPTFNYQEFFEFIELVHQQPFLKDLDADKQKQVPQSGNWPIHLKGEAYSAEQLKDYGINIDPAKTTLYKTDSEKQTLAVGTGIGGWLELAHSITYSDDNKTKLQVAFTNSPTQQLLEDLKTWTLDNGMVTDGTYTLPESLDSIQVVKDQLEMEKLGAAVKLIELKKTIEDKTQERNTKQGEITAKETAIDALIKEIIAKKRETLASYNLSKGFAKTTEDNRREWLELLKIKQLLLEIRYLENDGDATANSSVTEENTALTEIESIRNKLLVGNLDYFLVDTFLFLALAGDSKLDIQQAISRVKAGKYTEDDKEHDTSIYGGLARFKTHFENKQNLVKLNDWELEAKKAIEKAINQEDNINENLTDWQTKLKALDSTLDETLITETWKTKWGQVKKHGKISEVETLLKKVFGSDGKVKSAFIEEIKKSDATLTNLKSLLQKEPKDIITYIARFTYNQLPDTGEEKNKQKTQMKRRIAKKLNKTKESELKDEELNDSLYKIEIEELTIDNKFYTADLKEITTTQNPENDEQKSSWKAWFIPGKGNIAKPLITYTGIVLGLAAIGVAIFWKQIKSWWQGPEAVEESSTDTTEVEEDDKE